MSQTPSSLADWSAVKRAPEYTTQGTHNDWDALTPAVRPANQCPLCGLNLGDTQSYRHIPDCPRRGDYPQ